VGGFRWRGLISEEGEDYLEEGGRVTGVRVSSGKMGRTRSTTSNGGTKQGDSTGAGTEGSPKGCVWVRETSNGQIERGKREGRRSMKSGLQKGSGRKISSRKFSSSGASHHEKKKRTLPETPWPRGGTTAYCPMRGRGDRTTRCSGRKDRGGWGGIGKRLGSAQSASTASGWK